MARDATGPLDAARAMYRDAKARGDAIETLLIRKMMYRAGVGRLFDTMRDDPPDVSYGKSQNGENIAAALRNLARRVLPDTKYRDGAGVAQALDAHAGSQSDGTSPVNAQRAAADAGAAAALAVAGGGAGHGEQAGAPITIGDGTKHPGRFDLNGLAQEAARLRDALAARTMTRAVHETDAGALDRSRLAQIGAGLTLRPYQDVTHGRSLDTAVCVMIDRSGSMLGKPLETVCRAAWAIARACADARVPLVIGCYDRMARIVSRGGNLAAHRKAIDSILGMGGTSAPTAILAAQCELLKLRAKRRVCVMLCDDDVDASDPRWLEATRAGIDWRMTLLKHPNATYGSDRLDAGTAAAVWRGRFTVTHSANDAAQTMLRGLRELLDKGAREDLAALAQV